jgi:hypothetical protein
MMDDVFTIEARHEGVPVLAFSHRLATCSVAGEKMTEEHVQRAVETASARADLRLAAFEVGPEVGERSRYAIAVELARPVPHDLLATFLRQFERELRAVNISYEQYRDAGLLSAPVLYQMAPRYFETTRRERARASRRSDLQMKASVLHTTFVEWCADAITRIDG